MRVAKLLASSALLLATSTAISIPASAQTAAEDAAVFGARPSVRQSSLSPDGMKFSYIAPYGTQGEALYVVDLAQAAPAPVRAVTLNVERSNLNFCEWATNDRLVCQTAFTIDRGNEVIGISRVFAVDADGENVVELSQSENSRTIYLGASGGSLVSLDVEGDPGKVLMTRDFFREDGANTRLANTEEGRAVVSVDIDNGRARKVESPEKYTFFYLADDKGVVRIKGVQRWDNAGNLVGDVSYHYREPGSSSWKPIPRADFGLQSLNSGFSPRAIDAKANVVYGFERNNKGFLTLSSQTLDDNATRRVVLERDDVDVDGLVRIGRSDRVVGASYATEKRYVEDVDSELDTLTEGLAKALPDTPLISFVGADEDESRLLVAAGSDTDPGTLYLFDKQAGQLSELLPLRDGMADRAMGKMKSITFPAADGTQIPGYLTLPPGMENAKGLKAIVLPHGGPSGRDEWGFDWLVQFFAARGYAVMQPNFRGSSGYGADWFGRNGFQQWKTAVGDVNDAGRWLVSQGIADPARVGIVGWSYGGYAALQSQVLDPQLFKAVVAIAPVTDLRMLKNDADTSMSRMLVRDFVGDGPHVEAGSPYRNADRFAAPVLMFHGDIDQNVEVRHSREMEEALRKAGKRVEYVEFDKLHHSLDDSEARKTMLLKTDTFLSSAFGS